MKPLVLILILVVALAGCRTRTRYDTIFEAIAAGDVKDVRAHLRKGVPIETGAVAGMSPLRAAIMSDQRAIVRLLIDRKADVHFCRLRRYTLMHDAAEVGDTAIARSLFDAGLSIDARGPYSDTALSDSIASADMVRWLLQHGANPNGLGHGLFRPLHRAAWNNRPDLFLFLLDAGADPALSTHLGSPADSVARWRCPECVRLLIERARG